MRGRLGMRFESCSDAGASRGRPDPVWRGSWGCARWSWFVGAGWISYSDLAQLLIAYL